VRPPKTRNESAGKSVETEPLIGAPLALHSTVDDARARQCRAVRTSLPARHVLA
jgi:hypothetical protein